MNILRLLVGLGLAAVTVNAVAPRHKIVLKSLQRAQHECRQYLPEPVSEEGTCEAYCEQLVLRSWSTATSELLYIPYGRHFKPDCTDLHNLNRTLDCLCTRLAKTPVENVCYWASAHWECYRDQFGALIDTPQIAPQPELLIRDTIEQCARILQVSDRELLVYASHRFTLSSKSRALQRCILIRQGLYTDETGPNLDLMYVQGNGYNVDEVDFIIKVSKCVDRVQLKCSDNSTMVTRVTNKCFPPGTGPLDYLLPAILAPIAKTSIDTERFETRATLRNPLVELMAPLFVSLPYALSARRRTSRWSLEQTNAYTFL
ncbi:general odorant-binding protein 45-like [Wyeomyia smithii]|uniref:general odorant-binding protein 45-like n=1 Tax=Wyeomyia smithii TaxID=174621 RepID=UPI002467D0F1|nr:general odorant-binding protein 45-like [Wyeomyia smithii]